MDPFGILGRLGHKLINVKVGSKEASAQGVSDPSSDDLGLFNLNSQTRRSQTARGQLTTRSARWTARVPDLSNQTARDNISSRSDQFQLAVDLFGGPFNPT
ncbi:hypothetical protein F2Q70_00001019 [Brassica cretica]|uniref:Uncharacterized protein n=1 Tax=Brassica cretica TaxID=69181 RepID=A0A8S9J0J2_BRACR|nr:hypothetical protein F2Q70_00001019 [Brassica cretica]